MAAASSAADTDMSQALAIIKSEPLASSAERFAAAEAAQTAPEAKRFRAGTRPHSAGRYAEDRPDRRPPGQYAAVAPPADIRTFTPITPMVIDVESSSFQSVDASPGTPEGAGHGTVSRNDMAAAMDGLFERMVRLMEPRHQEIQQSVAAAIQPLQGDLEAMGRRLRALEWRCAGENAEGDQQWPGWSNWGDDEFPAWHRDWVEYPPAELTWAQRAAQHAKGDGKGAKSGKNKAPAAGGGRPSPPPKLNPGKIRITTLNGARVKLTDIKEAVLGFILESDPAADIIFNGSVYGKAYTATFRASAEAGALCVKNALARLKCPEGGYRKLYCPSPIEGQPAVQLFLNMDKAPAQMAADYNFRALKRAVKAVHDDAHYLCETRDQVISLAYRPLVQLMANRGGQGYRVVWHRPAANGLFTAVQQEEIAAAYAATVAIGSPRG